MAALKNFMENNVGYIIAIVALFISLMTLFTFLGVDFNPHGKEHIEKIVTIEGMLAPLDDNEESTVSLGNTQSTTNDPTPAQLEDSSEMTGSSSMVTTSTNQAKELQEKKRKRKQN